MPSAIVVQRCASSSSERCSAASGSATNSSDSPVEGSGAAPAASNSTPLWTSIVASPPSSRIRFGPPSPASTSACSVHHQYSVERLALPGEDRHALGVLGRAVLADDDRGGGVVLRREDVARAPADLGAERRQRLDQHGRLDRHVQRARDARALQRLRVGVLRARLHQAGHLVLGHVDLLAAVVGERDVGDLVVVLRSTAVSGVMCGGSPLLSGRGRRRLGVRPGEGQELRVLVLLPAQPLGRAGRAPDAAARPRTTRRSRPRARRRGAAAARSRRRRGRCRSASRARAASAGAAARRGP